mgnify:CR=1 FL=1
MSIKPKYAAQIYDGTKVYEIRKVLPKQLTWGDTIYFYESSTGVITGKAIVDTIIAGTPDFLYKKVQTGLGIGYDDYKKYVGKVKQVYYIGLADAKRFSSPLTLHNFHLKRAPQSFCYLR